MDIAEAFSSESEPDHSLNSQGRETITTESHRDKTKNIRKKYEPILDAGKLYRFEDNPSEYKRLRKKIQNRESATRVRGRKKNAFESLEQEVEYVRKENTQLQLANAKLETENKSLRGQVDYLKTLIRPSHRPDPIEDYLSSEVLTHHSPVSPSQQEEPLFEEFNWLRSDSDSSALGWLGIAVFTIVLGVFVLPSGGSGEGAFSALQVKDLSEVATVQVGWLEAFAGFGRSALKYGLIVGYLWLVFRKVDEYLKRRKLKKV